MVNPKHHTPRIANLKCRVCRVKIHLNSTKAKQKQWRDYWIKDATIPLSHSPNISYQYVCLRCYRGHTRAVSFAKKIASQLPPSHLPSVSQLSIPAAALVQAPLQSTLPPVSARPLPLVSAPIDLTTDQPIVSISCYNPNCSNPLDSAIVTVPVPLSCCAFAWYCSIQCCEQDQNASVSRSGHERWCRHHSHNKSSSSSASASASTSSSSSNKPNQNSKQSGQSGQFVMSTHAMGTRQHDAPDNQTEQSNGSHYFAGLLLSADEYLKLKSNIAEADMMETGDYKLDESTESNNKTKENINMRYKKLANKHFKQTILPPQILKKLIAIPYCDPSNSHLIHEINDLINNHIQNEIEQILNCISCINSTDILDSQSDLINVSEIDQRADGLCFYRAIHAAICQSCLLPPIRVCYSLRLAAMSYIIMSNYLDNDTAINFTAGLHITLLDLVKLQRTSNILPFQAFILNACSINNNIYEFVDHYEIDATANRLALYILVIRHDTSWTLHHPNSYSTSSSTSKRCMIVLHYKSRHYKLLAISIDGSKLITAFDPFQLSLLLPRFLDFVRQ